MVVWLFPLHHTQTNTILCIFKISIQRALVPTRNIKRSSFLFTSWFGLDSIVVCPTVYPGPSSPSLQAATQLVVCHLLLFSSHGEDIPLLHIPDSFIPPLATTAVAHNATVTELGFSSVPPQWSVASIRFTTNWTRAYSKLFTIKPERRLSSCC